MKKIDIDDEGFLTVFNPGTEDLFTECSVCGHEDNDRLFIMLLMDGTQVVTRCPKCGARITKWIIAEEE